MAIGFGDSNLCLWEESSFDSEINIEVENSFLEALGPFSAANNNHRYIDNDLGYGNNSVNEEWLTKTNTTIDEFSIFGLKYNSQQLHNEEVCSKLRSARETDSMMAPSTRTSAEMHAFSIISGKEKDVPYWDAPRADIGCDFDSELDTSTIRYHVKELDSRIVNANELLRELDTHLSLGSLKPFSSANISAIVKTFTQDTYAKHTKMLSDWTRNRRNLQRSLQASFQSRSEDSKPSIAGCKKASVKTIRSNKEFDYKAHDFQLPPKPIPPSFPFIVNTSMPPLAPPIQLVSTSPNARCKKTNIPSNPISLPIIKENSTKIFSTPLQATPTVMGTYPCAQCPKSFTQKSQWRRHVECVHLNLVKYICDICNKGFKRSDHLKNHFRRMHRHV